MRDAIKNTQQKCQLKRVILAGAVVGLIPATAGFVYLLLSGNKGLHVAEQLIDVTFIIWTLICLVLVMFRNNQWKNQPEYKWRVYIAKILVLLMITFVIYNVVNTW